MAPLRPLALLLVALAAPGAAAQQGPPPPAAPVAVTDLATQAEAVARTLQGLALVRPDMQALAAWEERLLVLHRRVEARSAETLRTLRATPPLYALDGMLDPLTVLHDEAQEAASTLGETAKALDDAIARLDALRATWSATAEFAPPDLPDALRARIAGTVTELDDRRTGLATERARVLVLLNRATQEALHTEQAIARVDAARREILRQPFARVLPPIWTVLGAPGAGAAIRAQLAEAVPADVQMLGLYVDAKAGLLAGQLVVVLLLAFAFSRMARTLAPWAGAEPDLARPLAVLGHPLAAAVALTLVGTDWVGHLEPRALRHAVAFVVLVPLVVLLRRVLDARLHPLLPGFVFLWVLDRVRDVVVTVPVLERTLFLGEILVLVAVVLAWVRWLRRHDDGWTALARSGAAVAVVLALTAVAAALGYSHASRFLEVAVLDGAERAAVLLVVVVLGDGVLAWLLRVRPLRLAHVVQRHRGLVERRGRWTIRVLAVVAWGVMELHAVALAGPTADLVAACLDARLVRGGFDLSVGDVLAFVLALGVALQVSRFLRFVLEEDVYPRVAMARGVPPALSRIVHYTVVTLGLLAGFAMLGVGIDRLTIIGSAFGVGIGFGLQNVVNNFVSGLILLFERPIQVGDSVQLGELLGEVHRIGIRSSTVRTWEGSEVIVPNANLVSDQVTNWTLSDRNRRIDLPVEVDDAADPARVVAILEDVALGQRDVLSEPRPVALFMGFGADGLQFELRAWTARRDGRFEEYVNVRSDLGIAVHKALAGAGIALSSPVRELRVAHVATDAAAALRGDPPRG